MPPRRSRPSATPSASSRATPSPDRLLQQGEQAMRRVVITGMGMVTPLGDGVDTNWRRLMAAESGIRAIQAFDTSDLATKIGGEEPQGDKANGHFNSDLYMLPKDQRKVDKFILFGMAAARQAIEDSGWKPTDDEGLNRTGVMIGAGIGGLSTIYE